MATGDTVPAAFTSCARDRGFTLIEALVVLAVVGLIAGLAYPAIERAQAGLALREARGAAEATLASARARALRTGAPVDLSAGRQGLALNGRVARPEAVSPVRIEIAPADIRFLPDGSVTGGRVTLIAANGSTTFAIAPGTGTVTSLEGQGATSR
ncbi:prepilin-type N-terminal cleavage/methylation domain-containing protein [Novosphingobium sp. HBC54]|uniref:Prepilin-type N-terminal cleavage/methylation domain-containing protein n=1 Tax=Novosphingobium cyanobacteriorum TaxID=3024215 RepID=A0ABT6CKE4_9SPHN|nr:prepilin-type N-terminal cleavage/methylation domain-containing protein [Novosphingobium cyanobacteriorum]